LGGRIVGRRSLFLRQRERVKTASMGSSGEERKKKILKQKVEPAGQGKI